MPKLPDPRNLARSTPGASGPAGAIRSTRINDPGVDTSIGEGLSRIGDEAFNYAMQEKARLDDVVLSAAKNRYMMESLNLEAEYSQIKGENAVVDRDIVADYTTKLEGVNKTITAGFKNSAQQKAWDKFYGADKVRFTAGIMQHKLIQSDQFASDTYIATNNTRIQNGHNHFANNKLTDQMARDIKENIAKEAVRAGWGSERTVGELQKNLGALWSGVAVQYVNAKQYDMAKDVLSTHNKSIGVDASSSINRAISAGEIIDVSQQRADKIMSTVQGDIEQLKAARDISDPSIRDATVQRVKARQVENRVQKENNKRDQTDHDVGWINDTGVEALEAGILTIDQVEASGMSNENMAMWKNKVFQQGEKKNAEKTNDKYAEWLANIALNPWKYTPDDFIDDISPNEGGLTGPQFQTLVHELGQLQSLKPKTEVTSAHSRAKTLLTTMYNNGEFGKVKTGKSKLTSESWKIYSDVLVDYQRKIVEEPSIDHTDWLNNRLEQEGTKMLQEKLDKDFKIGKFGDESTEIITEYLIAHGKAVNPANIERVKAMLDSGNKIRLPMPKR